MNSTGADTGQAEGTEEASKGDRAIRTNDSEIEVSAEMIRAGAEVLNQMDGPLMSETYMASDVDPKRAGYCCARIMLFRT
jgi:hypothetical protein